MPIQPPPMRYTCNACQWSTVKQARSDAILPGFDTVIECPKCSSSDIQATAASSLDKILNTVFSKF